jgi:hypothetical protein
MISTPRVAAAAPGDSRVAVLLVDTDRSKAPIDERHSRCHRDRERSGGRIVIKAVNYAAQRNTLLVRLQGAGAPEKAIARLHTISAGLKDSASLDRPDAIRPASRALDYLKNLAVELDPYTVAVVEIRAA